MAGRKKLAVSKSLEDVSTSGTKVPRVQCKFCQSNVVKNGSRMKTHVEKCISCFKLVKDKYLANLNVSTASITDNDSDESEISTPSEIETWLFDFSTSSAKPIPKKPKQIDARSTLLHFTDKMSTSEQEKLNALLARAMHTSGTPFCMVENSYWQAFFKAIRPAYVVPSRYEVSESLLVSEYEKTREEMLIKLVVSNAAAIMCDGWSNIRRWFWYFAIETIIYDERKFWKVCFAAWERKVFKKVNFSLWITHYFWMWASGAFFVLVFIYFYYFFVLVFNCFFSTTKMILSSFLDMCL